jgi:hypothetical protein
MSADERIALLALPYLQKLSSAFEWSKRRQTSALIVSSNPRPYDFRGSLRRKNLAFFHVGGVRGANRQVCA